MIWMIISGFPDYEISEFGEIRRSVPANGKSSNSTHVGKIISQSKNPNGYMRSRISKDKKGYDVIVHRLVIETFHGKAPTPKHQAAHNDGNRTNNHYSNLRWATRSENEQDKKIHGTNNVGEKHGMSRLKESQVLEIISSDLMHRELANKYGVARTTISSIKNGRSWAFLNKEDCEFESRRTGFFQRTNRELF